MLGNARRGVSNQNEGDTTVKPVLHKAHVLSSVVSYIDACCNYVIIQIVSFASKELWINS